MGSKGKGYSLNIFEKGGKGGHFGGARSPLPLPLGNVLQPICGPIPFIRNLSIFSFSAGFSNNPRLQEIVSDPGDKVIVSIYLKMGLKGGHFRGARRPLNLLLGNVLQPICGPIVFIPKLSIVSFSESFSEKQRYLELVSDPRDNVMSSLYLKMGQTVVISEERVSRSLYY